MSADNDPIIDSLLEEAVGGQTPPDLSARILRAWSEQQRMNGNGAPPLNVFADVAEPLPPPIVVGSVVRTAYDPIKTNGRPRRRNKDWSSLPLWSSLGAAAAVVLTVYVGAQMSNIREPLAHPGNGRNNVPVVVKPDKRKGSELAHTPNKTVIPNKVTPAPSIPSVANNNNTEPSVDPIKSPNEVLPPKAGSSDAQVVAFINEQLKASWKEHGISPAAEATDTEWCRRAYLRLIGRIPTIDELTAFADDKSADKQEQLVDRLLNDEQYAAEFARHWSDVFANVLIGRGLGNDPQEPASRAGLQEYLQASLRQNKPYDRMALELISATGAGQPGADNFNGAANFLLAHATDDAAIATARTCRVFLGVQLQCVQCHDHPTAPLRQNSFWGMNAFFRQMKLAGNRNDPRELIDQDFLGDDGRDEEGRVYYAQSNGIMKVAAPTFLDGTELAQHSGRVSEANRREQLAKMVVDSKYFSQATMNRLWSQFLGFGFTPRVDDMVGATASHPALLNRVSEEFAANGYDLKKAMRWIALSDAFNRSSKVEGKLTDNPEAGTVALFSHYYTRQLPAEEVYRSLQIAAKLRKESGSGSIEKARQSWLAQVARKVGDDGSNSTPAAPTILPTPIVKKAVTPGQESLLQSVLTAKLPFEAKVEHLFMAALSRKPSRQELELARSLGGMGEKNEAAALEDIWWALLNSSEFVLDH